jgi:hypothetical protein
MQTCDRCTNPVSMCLCDLFKSCVIYQQDSHTTEVVLADVPTVWHSIRDIDLGYDMDTEELVAIRVNGDVRRWPVK